MTVSLSLGDFIADYVPDSSGRYQIFRRGDVMLTLISGEEAIVQRIRRAPEFDQLEAYPEADGSWHDWMLDERFERFAACGEIGGDYGAVQIDGEAFACESFVPEIDVDVTAITEWARAGSPYVTVRIGNTYSDGHTSTADVEIPRPPVVDDDWWEDAVFRYTGDGHGVEYDVEAAYTATIIVGGDVVGRRFEWA